MTRLENRVELLLPTPACKVGDRVVMKEYRTANSGDVTGGAGQIVKVTVATHIEVTQKLGEPWETRKWKTGPRYQVILDGKQFLSDVYEWNFKREGVQNADV